jgi:signal transduction histidine kinase
VRSPSRFTLLTLDTPAAMTEVYDNLRRLADEQGALRRVAELVARGSSDQELFDAVAIEASGLVGGEGTTLVRMDGPGRFLIIATCGGPNPVGTWVVIPEGDKGTSAAVLRSHKPERRDDYKSTLRHFSPRPELRPGSSISLPIMVEGELWGLLGTLTEGRPLPAGVEDRLEPFTELIAAAIANSQARAKVQQLIDDQAALLRVAELVAAHSTERALFEAVAIEASGLIDNEPTTLVRYEGNRTFTIVATCGGPAKLGTRVEVPEDDRGTLDEMMRTRAAARLDRYDADAPLFSHRDWGVGSSVSVPIIVGGELWGSLGTLTKDRPLPLETENRLQKFAELVAAALANSQARAAMDQLAADQGALLRIAEMVARGAALETVFLDVSVEASMLLGEISVSMIRYDDDGYATVVSTANSPVPLGMRIRSDGDTGTGQVLRTGQSFRMSTFAGTELADLADRLEIRAAVVVPITVEGRVWGALATSTSGPPPPARTERRLQDFAALAAAAIGNAQNKANLTASRARVVTAADETRRQLQRDVHDGAQQRLVQTVLALKLASNAAMNGQPTMELIGEALGYAERASSELRDIVHGILPASLSRGGLQAGLESLIADLPLSVELIVAAPRLPLDVETTAYFVVAEALTNVIKHARASHATVECRVMTEQLSVVIEDDGVGGADPGAGTGLTGLLDRVATAEGTLQIHSLAGEGTTLRVTLPVHAAARTTATLG